MSRVILPSCFATSAISRVRVMFLLTPSVITTQIIGTFFLPFFLNSLIIAPIPSHVFVPSRGCFNISASFLNFALLNDSGITWNNRTKVAFNPWCANRNTSRLLFSSAEMFKKLLWQTEWTPIRLLLRSSLFWIHTVSFYAWLVSNVRQLFAADDFSRRHFFLALSGLRISWQWRPSMLR